MAPSATLSIFVPEVGETVFQDAGKGAKVFTTNNGTFIQSGIIPGPKGSINNLDIKGPTSGDTKTTISGKTNDVSYVGNSDANAVNLFGKSTDLTLDLKEGNDQLLSTNVVDGFVSLGEGDNKVISGPVKDSFLTSGSGADEVIILGNTTSTTFATGGGDDTLLFGGAVKNVNIAAGQGADEISFYDKVQKTRIDLGGDSDIDTVFISAKTDLGKGVVITGAGNGDRLVIGGEEYVYNADNSAFISSTNDSVTFG
ncbi:hypothetical protein [Synechococcus sp. CCY 9618]|uniref:hypothetical protein n=1 Tax=Synechococcus sp. CCY 9618 TaxID=2815602 RepID=UPI001C21F264|nr:hypothetical protein [Synechococcus sp. CCY 9618]